MFRRKVVSKMLGVKEKERNLDAFDNSLSNGFCVSRPVQ